MHAEAYDRTRQEHLQFAEKYAQAFVNVSNHRPGRLEQFQNQVKKLVT